MDFHDFLSFTNREDLHLKILHQQSTEVRLDGLHITINANDCSFLTDNLQHIINLHSPHLHSTLSVSILEAEDTFFSKS